MELLGEYQSLIDPLIRSHGGAIDKYLGDGIMATFGAAIPSETQAADALAAVSDILSAVDAWNAARIAGGEVPIDVRAAVTSGSVVFGAVGDEQRLEFTVIGNAVNLAAKLERHTRVQEVRALTTAAALSAAQSQGYRPPATISQLPAQRVEGVSGTIDLVVLAALA